MLLHTRSVSFACKDDVREFQRWNFSDEGAQSAEQSNTSWDDVDDNLTLESTLSYLSCQADWP